MKLIKYYNYITTLIILLITMYLWTIFTKINYNPNHIMKGHHDYAFNGYLMFIFYCVGWILFITGIILLKDYLMGENSLPVILIIYFGIIGYVSFLLIVCSDFDLKIIRTGAFHKSINLILPCVIVLIFSWTKYAKQIHEKSKTNKYAK
jgi:hypothetical protein